jgi:hypothetical protein
MAVARMCRLRRSELIKCYLIDSLPRRYIKHCAAFLCRSPIVALHWDTVQIDTLKTTNIHSSHGVAFWIDSLAKRMNAACGAKVMFDDVLVEGVGGHPSG